MHSYRLARAMRNLQVNRVPSANAERECLEVDRAGKGEAEVELQVALPATLGMNPKMQHLLVEVERHAAATLAVDKGRSRSGTRTRSSNAERTARCAAHSDDCSPAKKIVQKMFIKSHPK